MCIVGDEVMEDTTFEVVCILKSQKIRGQKQYKVRWAGDWKDSWETQIGLNNDELVNNYEAKVQCCSPLDAFLPRHACQPPLVYANKVHPHMSTSYVRRKHAQKNKRRTNVSAQLNHTISNSIYT